MAAESITFDALKRMLQAGDFRPVNILHGEEGYYVDELVKMFEKIIPQDDRDIALTNVYAPEVGNPQAIIDLCRSLPMMTDRQVIILREAQQVNSTYLDKLAPYVKEPNPSTIFVIASRTKKIEAKGLLKACGKDSSIIFESQKVWPSQVSKIITSFITERGLNADPKAVEMLSDFIGNDISRINNEIDKLAEILGPKATVTPEAVERNIGISKDYNNFELVDAIASRDFGKMMIIVRYFEANPRSNPYTVTTTAIFNFFADLLQAFYTKDRSEAGIKKELGIKNIFAYRRIALGMQKYTASQTVEIIDAIRQYDAMSKGVGSRQDPYKLLGDLMYHIATARGHLPC